MAMAPNEVRVATQAELQADGVRVVAGNGRRIAVFADGDRVFAVENNCPHMGFPLDRGSVRDGILTCHWHQARFDLQSGCTFDLWADDVPRYVTRIEDGVVFVARDPSTPMSTAWHRQRLLRAIEQNVGLVQAKSILALLELDTGLAQILELAVPYAARNLQGASEGLTRLGCVANLFSDLTRDTATLALYYAIRQLASDTSSVIPRRERQPLDGTHTLSTLQGWLAQWVITRHRDGAERTLLTGVAQLEDSALAALLFGAASERLYANGGHLLEDCNKAFEFAERLGRDHARDLFALTIPGMTDSRGEEESTHWHHPIEIVTPLRALEAELPSLLTAARNPHWRADEQFMRTLLGDDPLAVLELLRNAFIHGAPAAALARQIAYGAGLRLARFATSNEITDWFNPQHTLIHAHAAWRAVGRDTSPVVVRTLLHAAIALYHDRFLNVPPAWLPEERGNPSSLGADASVAHRSLLALLDQRGSIETVAELVSHWMQSPLLFAELVDALTAATVREDIDFHCLQVLDASVQQARAWGEQSAEARQIMVGAVRNLAAHCPTRRAGQQTAEIAARLHRGDRIYEA